jgi:Protein of unknown function (DUF3293)
MEKEPFDDLVESIKEAGAYLRSEKDAPAHVLDEPVKEAQAFSEPYALALYKTPTLTFTLSNNPTQTILFSNKPYSIITAHNPYSQQLSAQENDQRHKQLESILQERGLEHSPSTGQSPDGSWCEEGFIIFDISLEDALAIGKHFEQHAILYGQGNRTALAWCEDGRLEWFYPEVLQEYRI